MLVRQLGENDRVAIVVYAGAAGLGCPDEWQRSSDDPVSDRELRAGGLDHGGQGIHLAYESRTTISSQAASPRSAFFTDGRLQRRHDLGPLTSCDWSRTRRKAASPECARLRVWQP